PGPKKKNGVSSVSAVSMQFAGANRDAAIAASQALPGHTNYLLGNDPSRWRRTYRSLRGCNTAIFIRELIWISTASKDDWNTILRLAPRLIQPKSSFNLKERALCRLPP